MDRIINNINENLIYFILIYLLFIAYKIYKKKFALKYSHKWRIKSANKVLLKVNEMNEKQIFSYIRKVDAFVIEELILSALDKREDIKIIRNKRYTGDNGIDGKFILNKNIDGKETSLMCIIQAKRYSSLINPQHLRDFAKQIKEENASIGFFIHTGRTSKKSFDYVNQIDSLEIISGMKLISLLKKGELHYV